MCIAQPLGFFTTLSHADFVVQIYHVIFIIIIR